jgi:hypothetical protein
MARQIDDYVVMPGETFSLNNHVGQRTTAKGFVCAGALLGNELVEEGPICIGGGSSQFTTTMYNAIFFAGLEDVAHTPHSVYFSRYPEGREATLGWPVRPRLPQQHRARGDHQDPVHRHLGDGQIYGDNGGPGGGRALGPVQLHGHRPRYLRNASAARGGTGHPVGLRRLVGTLHITYPDGRQTTEWTCTQRAVQDHRAPPLQFNSCPDPDLALRRPLPPPTFPLHPAIARSINKRAGGQ